MLDSYLWLVFVILAVLGKTAFYTLQKRLLTDESSLKMSHATAMYGMIFITPFTVWHIHTSQPTIPLAVIGILCGIAVIEAIAFFVYLSALRRVDLGIASAFKNSKPTLVAISEPFVFSMSFSPLLLVGAVCTSLGAYIALLEDNNLLKPFRRLSEPGIILSVAAAGLYTILSLGSRYANTTVSPFVFGFIVFSVMSLVYTPILIHRDGVSATSLRNWRWGVVGAVGVFRSVMVWSAYALISATVVSTLTQLTVLTNIVAGTLLLGEKSVSRRLIGGTLILVGAVLAILVV